MARVAAFPEKYKSSYYFLCSIKAS